MPKPGRWLVHARQAGSAAMLSPVLDALGPEAVVLAGDAQALTIWQREGREPLEMTSSCAGLEQVDAQELCGMLTGSSFAMEDDARLWAWGRAHDLVTVAMLDGWVNYWQRFAPRPDDWSRAPDVIAVIDELAETRLVELGFPAARVAVVGHPGLDTLARWRTPEAREPGPTRWLFASEPLAEFAPGLGYTEWSALELLLELLASGEAAQVAIKRHPREAADKYREQLGRRGALDVVEVEGDRHACVARADIVVGMSSMLLYEASLMGKPVLSLQPHRHYPNDLVDGHDGILVATTTEDAASAVAALARGDTPPAPDPPGDATSRCLALLASLVQ